MIFPPKPTGTYGIARYATTLTDTHRHDPHDPSSHRSLGVDVYVPAMEDLCLQPYDERALTYWRNADFWQPAQRKILEAALASFQCFARVGETLPDLVKLCPTIVFSHGFGAWCSFYAYLIEELVSHGFAVIGVNHTHNAGIAEINGKPIYGHMTHQDLFATRFAAQEQRLWIEDIKFVVQQIRTGEEGLLKGVDRDNLFFMGQSFGGSTAAHLCDNDSPFKACINLDGALFGESPPESIARPFIVVLGQESLDALDFDGSEAELAEKLHITLEQAYDFKEAYVGRLLRLAERNKLVTLKRLQGIDHIGFTDFNFLVQSELFFNAPVGSAGSQTMIEAIRKEVLAYLFSNLL